MSFKKIRLTKYHVAIIQNTVEGLNKSEFKELFSLATKESYFIFNELFYKQIDDVAMGSPLGPTLANAFLCFYEKSG